MCCISLFVAYAYCLFFTRNHNCCCFKYLSNYLFCWLFFDGVLSLLVELTPNDEDKYIKDVKMELNQSGKFSLLTVTIYFLLNDWVILLNQYKNLSVN